MSNATSASDARASQLIASTPAIVERSLVYMPRDAFWEQRYAERARRFANEDGAFHVRYLADAIRASSATVMEQYARWLRDLLVPRGMSTLHVAEHLEHIGHASADCVGAGEEFHYIQRALEALKYDGGPARAIQDAADDVARQLGDREPAARGGERHSAFETRYLCHYAADALQRSSPALLTKHVDWSRSVLAANGIEPAAYDAWLTATRDELQSRGLPPGYLS